MKADFGRDEIETFFTDYNGVAVGEREEKLQEKEGPGVSSKSNQPHDVINNVTSGIASKCDGRMAQATCRERGNVRLISMKNRGRKEIYVYFPPSPVIRKQRWRHGENCGSSDFPRQSESVTMNNSFVILWKNNMS